MPHPFRIPHSRKPKTSTQIKISAQITGHNASRSRVYPLSATTPPHRFTTNHTHLRTRSTMAGESRTELIGWLNDLLQINYTKVEQCGSGAAYCQILDSVYGMNAKHEYEFLANYKVLQDIFKKKKIDKPIPVEKLVKCKMQDNLEFLQWIRRFWEGNYSGQAYDAVARRRGAPTDPPATMAPVRAGPGLAASTSARASVGQVSHRSTPGSARSGSATGGAELVAAQKQVQELSAHLEGLEKERDFYFAKLRDIEILAQQQIETLEAEGKSDETLSAIQKILYSTEEGFEVPEQAALDEEETF
ncbi:microtubule binding protein [Rhizoctonia solani AG-1 IA]|uniref:Microtubule binding protein n=1 Tax=Thanatephorus cucumeris (strain AG1-IA) TaxID=983506 RepID=L8WFZ2_THACA|nr:microtubule binding protein [Rhizoctonia solani AG-1 IA]